jgi:hypothetical protein
MIGQLPPPLRKTFDDGDQERFDREIARDKHVSNLLRFTLRSRSFAYGLTRPTRRSGRPSPTRWTVRRPSGCRARC